VVNDDRWIHRLLKEGKEWVWLWDESLTVAEFEERRAAGGAVEGYELVEAGSQIADAPTFDLNNPLRKPYKGQEFPRMLYHHERGICLVQTRDQHDQLLAQGWRKEPPDREMYVRKKANGWRTPHVLSAYGTILRELRHKAEAENEPAAKVNGKRRRSQARLEWDKTELRKVEWVVAAHKDLLKRCARLDEKSCKCELPPGFSWSQYPTWTKAAESEHSKAVGVFLSKISRNSRRNFVSRKKG
jgi:hypothetical protein